MTKKQKIEYIEQVREKFENASNHGHNGGNWWYPKQNTIAYNVKMYHGGVSVDDIREKMTARQNEYYDNDEYFYNITQDYINMECEMLMQDIEHNDLVVETGFAGRSGGWFEVEYSNSIGDYDLDDTEQINDAYNTAKKLEQVESEVEQEVMKRKAGLEKFLDSKDFIDYVIDESIMSDSDIAGIYKGRIKDLADKLK